MAENRVFGRDTVLRIAQDGVLLTTITAIKSHTFETRQRIMTENYLGEGSARQDEIFDEVGGNMLIHIEGPEILELQRAVADRASRREADPTQITLTFRITFPGGRVARIVVPDVKFDPIPLNDPARDAYVEMTLTYKGDRYTLST